jgi:membrane glycosyltransferase
VPAARLLQDWKQAHARALAYLEALGVAAEEREALAGAAVVRAFERPWEPGSDAFGETLRAVRELVCAGRPAEGPGDAFLAWRLERALAGEPGGEAPEPVRLPAGVVRATPEISRRSMVSEPIERGLLSRLFGPRRRPRRPPARVARPLYGSPLRRLRRRLPWTRVAHRRRLLLGALVLVPTTVASAFMVNVLPYHGSSWLELAIVVFFGALFGWISIGFWTAIFGFWTLVRGRDRFAITNLAAPPADAAGETAGHAEPEARTAIVMPICQEPVERVFAGLEAIERSLVRAGALDRFHFFILSDTSDPAAAVAEEEAWFDWCRRTSGFDRIFYRRRKVRLERKSGNVADFCRRWGKRYRYMVMLDADSVMRGETIARLVELMERQPGVGMIQTVPTAVNRGSLFARLQQFASRVYGPMFAAGLHYWQLGDGQYWGHNTIIRVEPFMNHCGLPRLPGREPLGGEILSHDFVEAALMGRAGWTLWLVYDLPGSYEEVPSTLLEEMRRDRRWCQGNLQHLRLLFTEGLFGAHRALFLNGALSYVSALLWFAFLTLSTVEAIDNALREPDYFPHGPSLFPEWPVWRPDWALALLAVIAMILFLPKALSILLIVFKRREARAYGGIVRLTASVVLEIVASSLLAPIRMVFHSRFVLVTVLGRTITWRSQGREDAETGWWEAIRRHGLDSLFASAWGASLFWLNPGYFWWVTPIIGALIVSVPVSVYASRVSLGERLRRWGLFLVPEESAPPPELCDLRERLDAARRRAARRAVREQDGFVRAVVDPAVNALHRAFLGRRRSLRPSIRAARRALVERALAEGPAALGARERRILLGDPDTTDDLHRRVWALAERERAARWGRPGLAVVCALLLAGLAGCRRAPGAGGPLEFWAMGREGEVVAQMMPEFERRHPGLRVRVQQIPWSAAHEKLLTAWVGEAMPDLFQAGNTWLPELVALGALERLDGLIAGSGAVAPADYFPGILDTNVIEGATYGIPWYVDTRLLFYRRDLLGEAGYARPPRTWAEWTDAMARVKARVGPERYAILLPLREWQPPVILALQLGGTLLRDGDRYGNFRSPPVRRAFAFYLELFRRGLAPAAGGAEIANVYQDFARGYFSLYVTGPWNIGEFARRLPAGLREAWATAPLPAPDEGWPGVSLAGGASLAILRSSGRKGAAWKLVEYLSDPARQIEFHRLTGDLPARRTAWLEGDLVHDRHAEAFWTQLAAVRATPKIPEWERIAARITEYSEAAVRGDLTLDEALAALDRDVDALLEKRRWLLERAG